MSPVYFFVELNSVAMSQVEVLSPDVFFKYKIYGEQNFKKHEC